MWLGYTFANVSLSLTILFTNICLSMDSRMDFLSIYGALTARMWKYIPYLKDLSSFLRYP